MLCLGIEDIRMPQLDEVRITGQLRRTRVLPLWKDMAGAFGAWLAIRPDVPDRYMLLNGMGWGMTRRSRVRR